MKKEIVLKRKERELLFYMSKVSYTRFNVKKYSILKNIPRSSIYDYLNKLENYGLVTKEISNNSITKKGKRYLLQPTQEDYNEMRRRNKKCYFCDYDRVLDVHHILEKSKGGRNNKKNLIVICPNCHALIHREHLILRKINKRWKGLDNKGKQILF